MRRRTQDIQLHRTTGTLMDDISWTDPKDRRSVFTRRFQLGCLILGTFAAYVSNPQTTGIGHIPEMERRWSFDHNSDREGWTVPPEAGGVVIGGALWLRITPRQKDPAQVAQANFQIYGDIFNDPKVTGDQGFEILSPRGLDFSIVSGAQAQVRLRIRNLSPITDLSLKWRSKDQSNWGEKKYPESPNARHEAVLAFDEQAKLCAVKPDEKSWQEVICYVDPSWQGSIDQIGIYALQNIRGDLWIDSIELLNGVPQPPFFKPDLASDDVVPRISIPGISQTDFAAAFQTLDRNLIINVPAFGFSHPFVSPGGYYTSGGWWEMDTSLATTGAKWTNERFVEGIMEDFREVQLQNPDGRIDLYGRSPVRGQPADLSQVPDFFSVAFEIARRTSHLNLRTQIYLTMRDYLDWWLSPVKRDKQTGLIWGSFEEIVGDRATDDNSENAADTMNVPLGTRAPVDLNTMVALGAYWTSRLAEALGRSDEAKKYSVVFEQLKNSINTYLWDEQDGVYYNYDLEKKVRRRRLMISTFFPLELAVAPKNRQERLIKRLVDPAQFWGRYGLTSLAKTEADYEEANGAYDGHAWWGDIWTERNVPVIQGLEDTGYSDLAAELNWNLICGFNSKYREYLIPSTGEGVGAQGFSWTASQYVAAIVDHLFGVHFDAIAKVLTINPYVPKALYGVPISLKDLLLPQGNSTRVSVRILQSSAKTAHIVVTISGAIPTGRLVVKLSTQHTAKSTRLVRSYVAHFK
jgi:Trehalase